MYLLTLAAPAVVAACGHIAFAGPAAVESFPWHTAFHHSSFAADLTIESQCGTIFNTLTQGLVHRDVKPTNILMLDAWGFVWLSDMGLTTTAQHLPGFVKGMDLNYLPPEYIAYDSSSEAYVVSNDLPALAELTTSAVDMYQLGMTIYQLITGSLPPYLVAPKGVLTKPQRLSDLLHREATCKWKNEIARNIASTAAAELLEGLLSRDPALRPTPEAALVGLGAWESCAARHLGSESAVPVHDHTALQQAFACWHLDCAAAAMTAHTTASRHSLQSGFSCQQRQQNTTKQTPHQLFCMACKSACCRFFLLLLCVSGVCLASACVTASTAAAGAAAAAVAGAAAAGTASS